MKPSDTPPRGLSLILRTALWSWLVALITLLIFAAALIPQQHDVFRQGLESKAYGLTLSLSEIGASSVINDDFTSAVDHSIQIMKGDPDLDFVMITRNNGNSVLIDRSGWRYEPSVGREWYPENRSPFASMGLVPLFDRRAFRYSHPLDFSGIQWGWIHVGLSLEGYDRGVASVFRRTALLAGLCVAISLAASAFHARHLIRPILNLRAVVQHIAGGDLATRARIERNDEVGALAGSVNTMAEALQRRDRILESVRFAAQQFLATSDWQSVAEAVLGRIADAAEVTRAYVFRNERNARGHLHAGRLFAWTAPGVEPRSDDNDQRAFDYLVSDYGARVDPIQRKDLVLGSASDLDSDDLPPPEGQETGCLVTIPIHCDGAWWGFLGLDDCDRKRQWTDAEMDSLRTVADMLGATIARQRAQDALLEATQTLEQRVEERTRALRERAEAEANARAELARAQQRLMEASRLAGMAEVATSVLHNVGNVLNSVGVSSTLVTDRVRKSKVASLRRVAELLRSQNGQIADFLAHDPKGRVLPEYLTAVCEQVSTDHGHMLAELEELGQNVEHIKKIVAMQQTYAKVSGTLEELSLAELIEDAIRMNAASFQSGRITVVRDIAPDLPRINVDRHRVLQILINLLRNAKQALDASAGDDRRLEISAKVETGDTIHIRVRDNGVGIAPDHLTRIFQHGFTTKREGHGFGLHSGANVAKEMGGRLTAHSDGLGRGAVFTLELPQRPRQEGLS